MMVDSMRRKSSNCDIYLTHEIQYPASLTLPNTQHKTDSLSGDMKDRVVLDMEFMFASKVLILSCRSG
jgi:hypothetical protein